MGISLLKGRTFTERDGLKLPQLRSSMKQLQNVFPDEDPVGKRLRNGGRTPGQPAPIVVTRSRGVKSLVWCGYQELNLSAETVPEIYVPLCNTQCKTRTMWRTNVPVVGATAAIRDEIKAVNRIYRRPRSKRWMRCWPT